MPKKTETEPLVKRFRFQAQMHFPKQMLSLLRIDDSGELSYNGRWKVTVDGKKVTPEAGYTGMEGATMREESFPDIRHYGTTPDHMDLV